MRETTRKPQQNDKNEEKSKCGAATRGENT
jgi:hypothetical protein